MASRGLGPALFALALAGCSDEVDASQPAPPADAGAPEADAPPGCAPGEVEIEGACTRAGVPADGCFEGFASDGEGGCDPILPAAPCPDGTMALPGETRCRPVSPCGAPPFGDIPVEANTQYVDGSYPGADSDGSAAKPWTTIQTAILKAESGAIVAIAAGTYPEAPFLAGKPLRIWGVCPEKVEISSVEQFAAFTLDADGVELHGVAITADKSFGLLIGPGLDDVLDRIWLHDTGDYGLYMEGFSGPTKVTVKDSLIERASGTGVMVIGAPATFDGVVVRAGTADAMIGPGRGIDLEDDADTGVRADVSIRRSVIEGNHESGIVIFGSDLALEGSVVRGTLPASDGNHGVGIAVQPGSSAGTDPSTAALTGSVVSGNHHLGISVVASSLTMDASVIAGSLPQESDDLFGDALCVIRVGRSGEAHLSRSLVSESARSGISNFGGTISIGQSAFLCNPIHLDGENIGLPFVFDDLGGNACGCGSEFAACQVVSTNLQAPEPIP